VEQFRELFAPSVACHTSPLSEQVEQVTIKQLLLQGFRGKLWKRSV
jgi:hypothetical protein